MLNVNSTIFKTIISSVDESRKTLALFNKDWNTYKTNWQNANGIGGKIGSIFTSSNANTSASVISNDQVQILRNWNNAVKHGCTDQATFNRIIANADENTKMYFAGLNKGKGSIEGLKNAQNVATQSTIGLTIAQTALNMAISVGLTALISLIVKGYDELANSVANCKERVEDLISSYESALSTANDNADRVEELADKYEDLSKGVNNLGENVSLTADEYAEYNDLVNEIAGMFPTLVQGYTDEGNAILNLKGNVEELRDAYKEAQQEAYNLLIASGEDSDGNDIIKQWEDTHNTGFWADLFDLGADDVGGSISVSDALEQLKAIQQMTAKQYREIERIASAGSRKEIAGLTDIEKEIGYGSYLYKALGLDSNSTDEEFREAQRQAKSLIQTYNAEIESALSDVETLANAYLMTNEDYDKLDAQSKTAASMIVNSLNADIANGFSSKEDVATYVDKIVQTILSDDKSKVALTDLFTMDTSDMSIDEIETQVDSYINIIATALKEDPIELKARLGFDNSDTEPLVNKVQGFLSDEFDNRVGELTLEELDIASKLEIPEGTLLTWDELIAKIKEAKQALKNQEDLWDYSTTITQLDTIKNKFDVLDKTYAKLFDGDKTTKIGFEDLSSINEAFKDVEGIDNYIQKLQEAGQNQEAVTTVMQDLIGAYLDYSGLLDNVTEENADLISQTLSELGVLNSKELVLARLSGELITMSNAEQLATTYGLDLTNITYDEINALIAEGSISAQVGQQLAYFAIQKQVTNDSVISTDGDCQNLINLAKTAGYSESVLTRLEALKKRLADNSIMADSMRENISNAIKNVFAEAELDAKNINFSLPEVKYNGGSATQSAIDKANKAAEDNESKFKEILDSYLDLYKAELDAGLTDFNTFLNKSRSLLDEYYRDGKISTKDYWDEVKSLYEYQLSIYDKVIKAVTRRYDTEIDKINDTINGIEKQNDLLQKQKDNYDKILSVVDSVYEKQIKSLEDEKQLLQDKIDEINDANSALDLQYRKEQALYELKRSQGQRNKLVFNGDEFVYQTDQTAIRDAQKNLQDIENEEIINKLEKEQAAIDESISKLEEYRDLWREISNAYDTEINQQLAIALWGKDYENIILQNRISDIESFKNNYVSIQKQIDDNQGLIDSYNEKIEYYQALKEQWQSLADEYENSVNDQLAAQILGANWEADILNGRVDVMNNFRNQYISIQQAIADAAWASANAQIAALNAVKAAEATKAQTSGGTAGDVGSTETKKTSTINNNMKRPVVKGNHNGVIAGAGMTMQRYGTGTKDAEPGVHIIGEDGAEIVRTNDGNAFITEGETIYPFEGGEVVLKASDTAKILANMKNLTPLQDYVSPFSGLNLQPIDYSSMVMSNLNLPDYSKIAPVNSGESVPVVQNINLTLPNVTNESGYERIIKELKQAQIDAMQYAHKR